MKVLFALSGLHRVNRGAEVAFNTVASRLAVRSDFEVTVAGSGPHVHLAPYRYVQVPCVDRERFLAFPRLPFFRGESAYEEFIFACGLVNRCEAADFDAVVACTFPFVHLGLRAQATGRGRPKHIYVTQNGDWPAHARRSEYRLFRCDGLVCTNPEYYERNRNRWRSVLIPNGVDPEVFKPMAPVRCGEGDPVYLMVSALIESKRVEAGIRAVAQAPTGRMVVAGDGPLRDSVDRLGRGMLGDRYRRVVLPRDQMPALYRSADVFLHMSQVEPSANAYLEALASGLPIVTHDRHVTRWTLEGQALLVDTDDLSRVAQALHQALELREKKHVDRRRDLVARRYDWALLADAYADFLNDVVEH